MSRGHQRERDWVHKLRADGWWAQRAPGSLGIDVIAAAPSIAYSGFADLHFYEIKSDAGNPYTHFQPHERRAMLAQAAKAGASAWLVWWPPRAKPQLIPPEAWPVQKTREAA